MKYRGGFTTDGIWGYQYIYVCMYIYICIDHLGLVGLVTTYAFNVRIRPYEGRKDGRTDEEGRKKVRVRKNGRKEGRKEGREEGKKDLEVWWKEGRNE